MKFVGHRFGFGSLPLKADTGGDGIERSLLEIPGSYPSPSGVWSDGVFQFIREADGTINHRYFLVK